MTDPDDDSEYFRLRAEWLRYRGHLFDIGTNLPTLAWVMEDARRLIEQRNVVGLLYLDLGADRRFERQHGWGLYDQCVLAFSEGLSALRTEGLIGQHDPVATIGVRSDKFVVFLAGAETSPLDEESLALIAGGIGDRLTEILSARLPAQLGHGAGFQFGTTLLRRDPMLRPERAIHRGLDIAMSCSLQQSDSERDHHTSELAQLIDDAEIVTFAQPVFDLAELESLGQEVFSRGRPGTPFEDPEYLFDLAERTGRLLDLERLCRRRSLQVMASRLKPGEKLFLNTTGRSLTDDEVAGSGFVKLVRQHGLAPESIVIEIAERFTLEEREAVRSSVAALKTAGFQIAIDDMGAGHSSLQSIVDLEPDYLKFDVALVRHIHRSVIKRSLLETLMEFSDKIGARVVAEGIEEESELETVKAIGVTLGQGHHLAAPERVGD